MEFRNFLFKNRSFTPIPIAITIIYLSEPRSPYVFFGLGLVILGELMRITAVSYAGGVTRTMNVGAPSLCTSGPYSRTRNPLYLGNISIYMGFTLFAGGKYVHEMCLIVFIYFTFQYLMIISLEEETLSNLFGNEYHTYVKNVPRLFPMIGQWSEGSNEHKPSNFYKTLKTEKRTLQNIVLTIFLIAIKTQF